MDARVWGLIILDGTGLYKKLKGTECLYGVSFWGNEVYFYTDLKTKIKKEARQIIDKGEVAIGHKEMLLP